MGYTGQTHDEFATSILAGAIAQDYRGPVYLQADHTQFSAEKYGADPLGQEEVLKKFIQAAVDAGFYNIDIDASTLVDLKKGTLPEQQKENAHMTARLVDFIREIEPEGTTISIGGEIGHIGGKNSTCEEFETFMTLVKKEMKSATGLSKVSVQTGTSHGGIVLADGSLQEPMVDFDVIKSIGEAARGKYGMGGVVQHGASTLPLSLFHRFPQAQTLEIHLATQFQTILFDHLPAALKKELYQWIDEHCANERKEGQTNEQFYYTARKRANGAFKEKLWRLPEVDKQKILMAWEEELQTIFKELKVENTA